MTEKLDGILTMVKIWLSSQIAVLQEERGDTNFISILILLAIVIILATAFIGFKDLIVGQVEEIVNGFTIH